jgi:oligopeptide/dipeptide ABC transporter ATP-binding protein
MFRAFFRAPGGIVGLVLLAIMIIVAVVAPILWTGTAATNSFSAIGRGPSLHHLLGTDLLGRDILLRVLVATRLSLELALAATLVGAVIGFPLGVLAAALPERARTIALRTIDALMSFPNILVAVFVGAILGTSSFGAVIGVGIALAISFARLASTLALTVNGLEYMWAARGLGIKQGRRLVRYVLPNIAEPLAIGVAFSISGSIVAISSLSFLGLGVQPPQYDWGLLLTNGIQNIFVIPMAAVGPAVAIAISSLAFGFCGEALARSTNPRLWSTAGDKGLARVKKSLRSGTISGQRLPRKPDWAAPARDAVLSVRDLVVSYPGNGGGELRVVDGISFDIARGEKVGIVGESGSGKTTTAMAIASLITYQGKVEGTVEIGGHRVSYGQKRAQLNFLATAVGIVYQNPMSSLNPALRIGTQLTESPRIHRGLSAREAEELAVSRLREVGIPSQRMQLGRHPHELSGGMRQRVMIAMGLMNEPSLLIADEPTTALDVTVQAQVIDVIEEANHEHGTAIVLISHNMGLISQICDRILVMYAGRIVEDMTIEQLLKDPLHPYTRALIQAVPDTSRPRSEELRSIPGMPPDINDRPVGCAYRSRCPLAMEKCATDDPALEPLKEGRRVACWAVDDAKVLEGAER